MDLFDAAGVPYLDMKKRTWDELLTLGLLLTPGWRGEKTAAQVVPELRRFTEQYLRTGKAPLISF